MICLFRLMWYERNLQTVEINAAKFDHYKSGLALFWMAQIDKSIVMAQSWTI